MGFASALGIAESELTLESQLEWHLQSNHYPPVPAEMAKVCVEAIDAYYEEDLYRELELPVINGFQVTYRGSETAPAYAIIEQHHLAAWLQDEEEEYLD